jgi:hypothetical protein
VAGCAVLNDVVLNQVLVAFGDGATVRRVIAEGNEEDGTCWCGGTVWQGRAAKDVERSLDAVLRVAREEVAP